MDRGSAGVWWRVLRFFLVEFPQVYRAELRFMLASLVLFAGPALAAFIGVQGSDELARRLLSPQLIALIQQWQGGLAPIRGCVPSRRRSSWPTTSRSASSPSRAG